MNGPSISVHSDDDDDIMTIDPRAPAFQLPPAPMPMVSTTNPDPLINTMKISKETLRPAPSVPAPGGLGAMSSSSGGSDSSSEYTTDSDESGPPMRQPDNFAQRMAAERERLQDEITQKKEILYQLSRLESKGYKIPRDFNMQSDLNEMRTEYERIIREKEVDASIHFQRSMLMTFVNGIEFLNHRFDPFKIKLDGWAENVHDSINHYDDIFEELHEKYKGSGRKMAPELRLLFTLAGSGFAFHMTNSMFKARPLPDVENVLRSDPELLRKFQERAMNQMAAQPTPNGEMPGMFNLLGGMMGFGQQAAGAPPQPTRGPQIPQGRPPMPTPVPQQQAAQAKRDIDSIISDIDAVVKSKPPSVNGAMSNMDDEIESLLESVIETKSRVSATSAAAAAKKARGGAAANKRGLTL